MGIYQPRQNDNPGIRSNVDISKIEKIVLEYTTRHKNTYGGQTNIRFKEARRDHKITQEEWNNAISKLVRKKLLRKNESITASGRNAINY